MQNPLHAHSGNQLVEDYIGTAYDNVKRVAESIGAIDAVSGELTDISAVATELDNLGILVDNITEVVNAYNYLDRLKHTIVGNFGDIVTLTSEYEVIRDGDLVYKYTGTYPLTTTGLELSTDPNWEIVDVYANVLLEAKHRDVLSELIESPAGYVLTPTGKLLPNIEKMHELMPFTVLGDFGDVGITIEHRTELLQDSSDDNKTYRYTGVLPYVVPDTAISTDLNWEQVDVSPNTARVKELYEANADTNAFTDCNVEELSNASGYENKAALVAKGVPDCCFTAYINSFDGAGYPWVWVDSSDYTNPSSLFCGAFIEVSSGAGWQREFKKVYAEFWGFSPDATASVNATAFQNAVNFCIANKIGALHWKGGKYDIDTKIMLTALSTATTDRYSLDLKSEGINESVLVSKVTGAIDGMNKDGFLFDVDGMSHSTWSGFTIDYSNSDLSTAGGIVGSCITQSFYNNNFSGVRFVGGTSAVSRYTDIRRSIKIIGNQTASQAGLVSYFNRITDCSFNYAYKHIECVTGDGDAGTAQPNATIVDGQCLFERYVVGVDFGTADECSIGRAVWFQQGQTNVSYPAVVNTFCASTNGQFIRFYFNTESGAGARPFYIGADSDFIIADILNNNSLGGTNDAPDDRKIQEHVFSGLSGIPALNYKRATDLELFGKDGTSHTGATTQKLKIYRKNGSPDHADIGFDDVSGNFCITSTNGSLDIRPENDDDDVIVADSQYDRSLLRLGNFRFWVDASGRLRMKSSNPTSDTDGTLVGSQS